MIATTTTLYYPRAHFKHFDSVIKKKKSILRLHAPSQTNRQVAATVVTLLGPFLIVHLQEMRKVGPLIPALPTA